MFVFFFVLICACYHRCRHRRRMAIVRMLSTLPTGWHARRTSATRPHQITHQRAAALPFTFRIGHRENIARKKVKIEFETKKCNKMKQNSRGYIFSIQLVIMPAYGLTLFRPSTFGRSLLRLNLQNLRRAHCRHTQTTSRVCVRAVYIFAARSTIETATYATNTTQKSEHKISFSIHKTRNLKK